MKAVILAAGYGTRFQKDLENSDSRGQYKHLVGIPKALLPVGGKPLIAHWMEALANCADKIPDVIVMSNDLYLDDFVQWSHDWPNVRIVTDGTSTNKTRTGAVSCINHGVASCGPNDDVIVIGGDTLFYSDFSLPAVLRQFEKRKREVPGSCLVVTCRCREEDTVKVGILETSQDGRVIGFLEKPQPQETHSRKSCPCFYIFSKESLPLIEEFLEEKKHSSLQERDATGLFIKYLYSRSPVYSVDILGRFDVGALATYIECDQYFQSSKNTTQAVSEPMMNDQTANSWVPATFVPGFHDESAIKHMKYKRLGGTGLDVSVIGLGGSPFGNVYSELSLETAAMVTRKALQNGVNYIDTAPWYGDRKSEATLGKILKSIPRKSYYIATKVGRYKPSVQEMFDFSAERTLRSVDESLELLGLDYVDVIQVHDLEYAPSLAVVISECLPALEEVKRSGKARHIGITGYPMNIYREVLERSSVQIDVVLSYCRLTMFDSSLLDSLPYFQKKGVGVINAAPIGMGLLSDRGPKSWHVAGANIRKACRSAALYCRGQDISIAKLAIHYALAESSVDLTLVGMETEDMVESNLRLLREDLTDLEKETMSYILKTFFHPLKNAHWEGVEVKEYWAKLKSLENETS